MNVKELAKGVREGKRRDLAKAITLVESNRESDQLQALELLDLIQGERDTIRIGISGVPGSGKSTFIEALGNLLIDKGHKVAVLAVDPSSPATGGSILGDKTRMETLSSREEAFIRPSPTSGTLGGVAKRTRESMMLCEAAGYDVILIETVGVGQSEIEVSSMVDCFLILMLPGAGDSLQGIKRGIMEITDVLVINKADGDQKKLAEQAVKEYEHAFHLLSPKYDGIPVRFLTAIALQLRGIEEAWEAALGFVADLKKEDHFFENRKQQEINWFKRLAEDEILNRLWKDPEHQEETRTLIQKITSGELSPSGAAARLIARILS